MATADEVRFYAQPAAMTSAGAQAALLAALPVEAGSLARVIHGLLLHEHFAPAYGVSLTPERRAESHLRSTAQMLDRLLVHDASALAVPRPLERRLVGVCRHFSVFAAAALRAHGIPARARCGFGAYFVNGQFEDHWVCEFWDAGRDRWILFDAQIDEIQRAVLKPDFDLLDVPRDRFVLAGDAWARYRAGDADPSKFGIFDMRGAWFIAGNVLRDFASLNNMEMLPWDVWGAMAGPGEPIPEDRLELLDRAAALTLAPAASFGEVRRLYEQDERLRVPPTVFNAVLQRLETI